MAFMDRKVLQKAEARKAELLKELAELDAFMAMYQRLAGNEVARSESALEGAVWDARNQLNHSMTTLATTAANRLSEAMLARLPKQAKIEEAVARLLAIRQPMSIAELVDRLSDRGYEIGGNDPKVNLSSILSRSQLFKYSRNDGGWTLTVPSEPVRDFGDTLPFNPASSE